MVAGLLALLILTVLLVLLDRAGGHVRSSDAYAVVAVALIAGAVAA